ncbi:MAG TPA: ferrous iron transport protein A [Phaeodactylibacter sp.]|nr:ferrous iron transport protein A [Phaeodactylibacter sp.]
MLLRINLNKKNKKMTAIPLSELAVGEQRKLSGITDPQLEGKLMAMGMLPGVRIELVRTALSGNTLYIKFNGYCLALRRSEARMILLN